MDVKLKTTSFKVPSPFDLELLSHKIGELLLFAEAI